ncbi:Zn(2)-C6 fungal-type domain-containing protein [Madurella fahalii]|uniref:Zn(2)-C6 fungal-type domain-containing protein n=1 Tax=Madurella fahalii TaxID=1157608 RepID=A0ABQ0GMI3_9PEZI
MRALGHRNDDSWTSFGQRRGISDPTRFCLDLTRTRAGSGGAARLGSYPSPPMSGSPPLPPKTSQEVAERTQGAYQATTQDVYRGIPATQGEERTLTGAAGLSRPVFSATPEQAQYALPRLEGSATRPLHYPQQLSQVAAQPAPYLPIPGSGAAASQPGPPPAPQSYATPIHHSLQEPLLNTPLKPQRKTKGHVASACVPCKKAHLRCKSTNKEQACVDVQHKKRGRPRLRDDSQPKYDASGFGSATAAMRRPLSSAYGPGPSLGMVYDDNLRRTQSYRVLKSQPAESIAPRFPERGLPSDANIYPPPLSMTTARASEEPVAFLTMNLEFSKASPSFLSAIRRASVTGLKLADVLTAEDRTKAARVERQAQEEQARTDPKYLPPVFSSGRGETVMQSLGFTPEEVLRYSLPWLDTFNFVGDDGQGHLIPIRAGLAKENSIYFVVLLLNRGPRPLYPTPSPSIRDPAYSYETPLQHYSQPTPLSATFDPRQSRLGDVGYEPRQPLMVGGPPHMSAGRSPGLPPTYATSPGRPEYPASPSPYQTPRSEVHPTSRPPTQVAEYQLLPLPRIRSPPAGTPQPLEPPRYQAREERSRVDIGGLLERPAPTKDPQRE